jgi:ABC-type Fe3+-hydroxamate transport system substrate-binding protein
MKVISLVPSWTETLIECGVCVLGRTRFCIHPMDRVKKIPILGGTKDVDWEKLKSLNADLLILDKEENPKSFAEESPIPIFASHIESLQDLPQELTQMGQLLKSKELLDLSGEWADFIQQKGGAAVELSKLPGLVDWIKKPQDFSEIKNLVYLIWKDPWMAAGPNTFIGSIFEHLGCSLQSFDLQKYPKIELDHLSPSETLLLFSSEPYPFKKKLSELKKLPHYSGLVDGELYSWFGLRSLRKLKDSL